ncbi:MAG: RHS repeat-associated core domain-containing protein, partial [Anaerolineales bacterium]
MTLGSPSTGAWYFVVGWHDAVNNVINIQVNNGTANSLSWSGGVFDGNAGFEIGGRNDTQPGYFDGRIDEVGLWKRVLGGDERTLLYRNGAGCQYAFNSCNLSSFVYDGDGARVQSTENGATTTYISNYYEWTGSAGVKYYYAGSQRVAMRDAAGTLYFLLGDHLGSTSLVATSAGAFYSEQLYEPWGAVRYSSGTIPTSYQFTGEWHDGYNQMYLMGARWFDPWIGRWMQADTIVPGAGNPQALNRYSYVLGNP